MDLRRLKYFIAVADEASFRKASERLHIAQPSLTRVIQQLEAEVGAILLRRSTRKVELTNAGRVFLHEAKGVVSQYERAKRRVGWVEAGEVGEIRISYTEFAIRGALPNILRQLRHAYPKLHLQLSLMSTDEANVAMSNGDIDIAFVIEPDMSAQIGCIEMWNDDIVGVFPDDHPLVGMKRVRFEDVLPEQLVIGNRRRWGAFRKLLDAAYLKAGVLPNVVQEGELSDHIFGLVAAGVGMTYYAASMATTLMDGIAQREIHGLDLSVSTYMLFDKDAPRDIINHLSEAGSSRKKYI